MVDERTILFTIKAAVDQFTNPMKQAQQELKKTAEAADGMSKGIGLSVGTMAKLGIAAGTAMAGIGAAATMLVDKYHALSSVTEQVAIMTGDSASSFTDLAIEMSSASRSASETAKTFYELAQSGYNTTEEIQAISEELFLLAKAFKLPADALVEILDPALKAFGDNIDWVIDNSDRLTYVLTNTQLGISQLGSAASRIGPDMKELGFTFEDYLATISLLSERGVVGRKAISEINQAVKAARESGADAAEGLAKASDAVAKYEIQILQLEEKQRKLNERYAEGGISQEEYAAQSAIVEKQLAQARQKFEDNSRAVDANNKILEKGVDKQAIFYQSLGVTKAEVEKMGAAMGNATGLTDKMAAAADKATSPIAKMARYMDNLLIRAGQMLEPYQGLAGTFAQLGTVMGIAGGAAEIVALATNKDVIATVKLIATKLGLITATTATTAATVAQATAQTGLATATTGTATATWGLNAALLANPYVAVAVAVIGLTAALVLLYQNCEEFRNIVDGIIGVLKWELAAALDWIQVYIRAFIKFLRGDLEGAFTDLRETWRKVCSSMPEPLKAASKEILGFYNAIIDATNELIKALQGLPLIGDAFKGIQPLNHITVDVFNHEDKEAEDKAKEGEKLPLLKPPYDMWGFPIMGNAPYKIDPDRRMGYGGIEWWMNGIEGRDITYYPKAGVTETWLGGREGRTGSTTLEFVRTMTEDQKRAKEELDKSLGIVTDKYGATEMAANFWNALTGRPRAYTPTWLAQEEYGKIGVSAYNNTEQLAKYDSEFHWKSPYKEQGNATIMDWIKATLQPGLPTAERIPTSKPTPLPPESTNPLSGFLPPAAQGTIWQDEYWRSNYRSFIQAISGGALNPKTPLQQKEHDALMSVWDAITGIFKPPIAGAEAKTIGVGNYGTGGQEGLGTIFQALKWAWIDQQPYGPKNTAQRIAYEDYYGGRYLKGQYIDEDYAMRDKLYYPLSNGGLAKAINDFTIYGPPDIARAVGDGIGKLGAFVGGFFKSPIGEAEAHPAPGMGEDQLGVPSWKQPLDASGIFSFASKLSQAIYGKETWQEASDDISDNVGDDLSNLGRVEARNASTIVSGNKDASNNNARAVSDAQFRATDAMIRAAQANSAYGASINQTGFNSIYGKVESSVAGIVNPIVAAIQVADADICYWLQNGPGAKPPEQLRQEQQYYNNPPPVQSINWGFIPSPVRSETGIPEGINRYPIFHSGGIVNKATLGLIAESGPEAVIPLDRLSGGAKEINIIIEMDSKVIARAVAPVTAGIIRLRQGIRG